MVSFFHAYDLRGRYPDEIGLSEAEKIGRAFGTFMDGEVLVGRDGRTHAEEVTAAFIEGIRSTGTDVLYSGMVPTPVVYFGTMELDVAGSAVVTASHNPPDYTGFKFSSRGALAMSREGGMEEIERIYTGEEFDQGDGRLEKVGLEERYLDSVEEKVDLERGLDVAVNFGNGVTSSLGKKLFERLGCEVTPVNDEIDGEFPNHLPAPGEQEAQEQLGERMDGKDLGVIFDGDGDRAGFMLDGAYVIEDEVLALFSERMLQEKKGKVVHDLRASKLVQEKIRESGGEPVETRVGHTFISEEIHRDSDVVFAGELSGHYYFPALGFPFDDGLMAAALMCELVSKGEVKKLESYPRYPVSPELRIGCPESAKQKVVEGMEERYSDHDISKVDGVKIYFEDGWALVRPSNTEEKVSVRCEADSEEDLERIRSEVEKDVRELIEQES